jgi:AcrR family transcriptional regulator
MTRRGTERYARMSELQHARIVAVAVEMLAELGYQRITVEQIAVRAGISRKTFYEHFEEREGCFVAAIEASALASDPVGSVRQTDGVRVADGLDPAKGLGRITYRTLCVFQAVAERPGGSNREIAELAGITDESHISRILRRLEGRGVVVRDGGPAHAKRSRGEANAWRLTAWGEEVRVAVERPARTRVPAPVK